MILPDGEEYKSMEVLQKVGVSLARPGPPYIMHALTLAAPPGPGPGCWGVPHSHDQVHLHLQVPFPVSGPLRGYINALQHAGLH